MVSASSSSAGVPCSGRPPPPSAALDLVGGLARRDPAFRQRVQEVRDLVHEAVSEAAELLRIQLDRRLPVRPVHVARQRAAGLIAPPIGSTRTALVLYSGVPMRGSPTSCVSQLTFASAKWSAIQTRPG